jgi:glycerol-3-phosphate dehydrogenase (NAD(P)+)
MKIAYLGTGAWGFCLASLLASKGHSVVSWTKNASLAKDLSAGKEHPHLRGHKALPGMHFTSDLNKALEGANVIVEAVTTAGLRPVFTAVNAIASPSVPVIITSKGIEQNSGLLLPEVAVEIFGESARPLIGFLSGPSYAQEVISSLPTSVVGTAFSEDTINTVCDLFTTQSFRVYPNSDIKGVAYGGALKNIIAIACGICEGLGLGNSAKAALMTRGLHEIRKLAVAKGSRPETLTGLSGMGDVCLTCGSLISRNCRFGYLLAQGMTPKQAEEKIEMVVEGVYSCLSARQISNELDVQMPITDMVYKIVYEGMAPKEAVKALMQRTIKEEHL